VFTYVCLGSADLRRSAAFYDPVMGALGLIRCDTGSEDDGGWLGWGAYVDDGQFELALWLCEPFNGQPPSAGNGTMVALRATTRQQVRSFHEQALLHDGTTEGEPGLRPHYGADFYVAYVRDPDGNKLAAVCRGVLAAS